MSAPTDATAGQLVTGCAANEAGATGRRGVSDFARLPVVKATIRPLWHRIRLGEGGLVGMATWAAAWESKDWLHTACVLVLSALLLAALYLYNDVSDRIIDAHNPSKVARHREPLLRHPRAFFCVSIGLHVAVCAAAWLLLGTWAAVGATALLVLNPLYSALLKRVAGLDVLVVGMMGAAVVALATSSLRLLVLAAAMTAISHAFQTRVDAKADAAAGIRSSAAAPSIVRNAIWCFLAASLACTLYLTVGAAWAASAIVPYALLSGSRQPNRAWGWTRVYFAAVWIAATVR